MFPSFIIGLTTFSGFSGGAHPPAGYGAVKGRLVRFSESIQRRRSRFNPDAGNRPRK
jgi:hypothetical protein